MNDAGKVSMQLRESGVTVVYLGGSDERVVSLTQTRLDSLREAIEQVRRSRPTGLIISGPSLEMFSVGADVNAIKDVTDPAVGEKLAREGQALFAQIESLPFRVVAAISGPCVGGACELALACTYRIITEQKSSIIGLPETKLGILPGFGGTQRLPRLIGVPGALDIILAGKTLRPKQALKAGLVDDIVPADRLIERAEQIAIGSIVPKRRRLSLVEKVLTFWSVGRSLAKRQALQQVRAQTKGFYPAPPAALEAVFHGLTHGRSRGFDHEAKELGRLIATPESKALVHIFLLSEAAKGLGKGARKDIENLHAIVIGAGAMGVGIAASLAKSECSVALRDNTDEALKRGVGQIKENIGKLRYLSESERSFILNRVAASTTEYFNASNAGFAIEAIFEDLDIKRKVLSDVARLMPPDAIVATNTSSLSVTKIAEAVENPSRVIGMHFFNPVEKMPLVEIVRAQKTDNRSIAIVAALTTKLGKFPIIVEDVPGFLINRILAPYLTEASHLLAEGYPFEAIDRAATAFGMPMGPVRLLDEVGLDIASHVSYQMAASYGERMKGPNYAELLVKEGRKGRKSGAGFYDFASNKVTPSPEARRILKLAASRAGGDSAKITERLVLMLVNEAVRCLDEGVAGTPGPEAAGQIDLGTVMGIGFPPFRGGILRYANALGAAKILSSLEAFEREFGARFHPAEGIRERLKSGKDFYSVV